MPGIALPPLLRLPLSTPSLGITETSSMSSVTAISPRLSTPSLGITREPRPAERLRYALAFNSLSRDHRSAEDGGAAPDGRLKLSTPSLGITRPGREGQHGRLRGRELSTPSLGITWTEFRALISL